MTNEELFLTYFKNKKFLYPLNLHSSLLEWFSKFLVLYPLSDKELKTFNILNGTSKKLGFLSRKMVKIAKEVGITKTIIDHYYHVKHIYKFYKNYNQDFNNIDKNSGIDSIIRYSFIKGKEYERHKINISRIHQVTILLLKSIVEKSNNTLLKI